MFEFLGEEILDIGHDHGEYIYTFFHSNNFNDFSDLLDGHTMRFVSCGYLIINLETFENNVDLSEIVKEKMEKYKANVSITFNNYGNVVDDSLNENIEIGDPIHYSFMSHYINVNSFQKKIAISYKEGLLVSMTVNFRVSENIYNTTICKFFKFTLDTSNDKYSDIVGSKEYTNKDERYLEAYIDHYSQLIEESPNIASYYYKRGEAYYKINAMKETIKDLNKVLSLDPEYSSASELIKIIRMEN